MPLRSATPKLAKCWFSLTLKLEGLYFSCRIPPAGSAALVPVASALELSEIRSRHAEFVAFDSCHRENSDAGCAEYSPLLLPFGFFQPLGHLLVICNVTGPALRSTIPAVVFDGHINAGVDEELHRLIVSVPDEIVRDACRLMGTPGRVDVRSGLK